MNKTVRDAIHRALKDKAPQPCEVSGVTYYNPQDVGKALEYGADGWDIVPWLTEQSAAGEFMREEHLIRLRHLPGAPVVLTQRGLLRVLMLCPKLPAAAFRDRLDMELAEDSHQRRKMALHDPSMPDFAEECLKREDGVYTSTADVYKAYCVWCAFRGVKPMTPIVMGRWLSAHGWSQGLGRRHGRRWENMRLRGA